MSTDVAAPHAGRRACAECSNNRLVRAVVLRLGAVVGAASLVGVGHDLPGFLLVPVAVALGVGVLFVWRRTRTIHKGWSAYLIYAVAIAVGLLLLRSGQASRDLGVPPPVAIFGGLGAVLAGTAALLSIARGSDRVRRPSAIRYEIAALICVLAVSWIGLMLMGRVGGSRSAAFVLLAVAAFGLFVVLALLSETLLVHALTRIHSDPGCEVSVILQRVTPQRLEFGRWWWPLTAVVILLAGVVWLVAFVNFNMLIVGAITVGLILLFVAVAADGVADMVVVLVIISLAWSLAPRTVEFRTEALAPGRTVLVALGDSYISGEGATRFYEGTNFRRENECRRAPSAYAPVLVERETDANLSGLVFLACSGAKAADLDARVQYEGEPVGSPPRLRDNGIWERGATQLEQLDEVLRSVRPVAGRPTDDPAHDLHGLVLLSLGGNDAGFGKIASSCVGLGDCSTVIDAWTADLALVESRLDRVYAALRTVVGPRVPILVIPYPIPVAERRCSVSPMTQSEHKAIRGFVQQLNESVLRAAEAAGFDYLDIQPAFDGHRICDTNHAGDWYLNYLATNPTGGSFEALSNPRNWFHNSFHPNAEGHQAIADSVEDWVSGHQAEIANSRFTLGESAFRATYLAPETDRPSERLASIGAGSCSVEGAEWESDWTACETAIVARRLLVPGLLVVLAAWAVGFTILHAYRQLTDSSANAARP